jgi:hypothetical protein
MSSFFLTFKIKTLNSILRIIQKLENFLKKYNSFIILLGSSSIKSSEIVWN